MSFYVLLCILGTTLQKHGTENRQFFSPKIGENADNGDPNIEPWKCFKENRLFGVKV
jgi:hypothetical protein